MANRSYLVHMIYNPDDFGYDEDNCGLYIKDAGIHHGGLTGLGDNDHCFSSDTEILTEDGFIQYQDIQKGQNALTLNLITNKLEYNIIDAKYVYDDFSEIISLKNKYGEILVTLKHTLIYKNTCKPHKNPKSKYLTCTAEESMDKEVFEIPVNANSDGIKYDKPLEFFTLLGLIISEGHFYNPKKEGYGISISQLTKNAKFIESIIDKLNAPYTKRISKNMTTFYIRSAWARENLRTWITEKRISNEIMGLRGEQFRAFLSGLIFGDGHISPRYKINKDIACSELVDKFDKHISYFYYTGDVVLKDQLSHLCTLNNLRAYSHFRKLGYQGSKGCWNINICNRETVLFNKNSKTVVPYSGDVWCVSVKNKTLVLRRNGFIFIAGNTQYTTGVTGDPLTYANQAITFHYDTDDFIIDASGNLQLKVLHGGLESDAPILVTGNHIELLYDTDDFQLYGNQLQINDYGIHHGGLYGLSDNNHTQYVIGIDGCPLSYEDQTIKFNYDETQFNVGEDCKLHILGSGIVNMYHSSLLGLAANDHTQYASGVFDDPLSYDDQLIRLNYDTDDFEIDGNGRITIKASGIDHGGLTGLSDNNHLIYASGVSGSPLTYSNQIITFNYDTDDFDIDGGNLILKSTGLPSGEQYSTLRYKSDGTVEVTDNIEIYDDGSAVTTDHNTGTDPRISNMTYIASGDLIPDASGYIIGTVLLVYNP